MKKRKKVPVRKRQRENAQAAAATVPAPPRRPKPRVVQRCDECTHEVNAHSTAKFGGGCIMCPCTLSKEALL